MSNKIVNDDDLPDGWIKRKSKHHPDQIYYFNTTTQKSQWTLPVKQQKNVTVKKQLASNKQIEAKNDGRKSDGSSFKISNHSKQIKKRQSKTPAQDRLKNVTVQLNFTNPTIVAEQKNNTTSTQSRIRKLASTTKVALKKINSSVDTNKTKANSPQNFNSSANKPRQAVIVNKQRILHNNDTNAVESVVLFPPRTPGQDRLNRLRHSLNPENENKPNESEQQILNVFHSEFGIPSNQSCNDTHSTTVCEDEPMEWETSDIFERIENNVYKEAMHPYIIPDTNVFLDELSCIRDTIQGDTKYNVLVPFVVLQELDRLKSRLNDSRISCLASGAIRFIYNELKSKSRRLQGQKATEDCVHFINVINDDDKILNCCLQMLRQSHETILISNDINLCNKAIVSGITSMTSKEYKAKYNR